LSNSNSDELRFVNLAHGGGEEFKPGVADPPAKYLKQGGSLFIARPFVDKGLHCVVTLVEAAPASGK
jgi:hypothetical protein